MGVTGYRQLLRSSNMRSAGAAAPEESAAALQHVSRFATTFFSYCTLTCAHPLSLNGRHAIWHRLALPPWQRFSGYHVAADVCVGKGARHAAADEWHGALAAKPTTGICTPARPGKFHPSALGMIQSCRRSQRLNQLLVRDTCSMWPISKLSTFCSWTSRAKLKVCVPSASPAHTEL